MKYQAKHRKKANTQHFKKSAALLIAMVLLITVGAGSTLAYLIHQSGPVTNTFQPSKVQCEVYESFNGTTKEDVYIKNTGDTSAWIRAAVVVTWKDTNGNVYGQKPVAGTDYTMVKKIATSLNANVWIEGTNDDYYYWTSPVKSEIEAPNDCMTGELITSCTSNGTKTVGDTTYYLSVEIVAEAIQSYPADAFNDAWAETSGLTIKDKDDNNTDLSPEDWTLVSSQGGDDNDG